jgi:hypothetical protein
MVTGTRAGSSAPTMSASDYHEASWRAYLRRTAPPDPSGLSDYALNAFIRYESPDLLLPSDAEEAVEAESKRRGLSDSVDHLAAVGVVALLGLGGFVIGWGLLVP